MSGLVPFVQAGAQEIETHPSPDRAALLALRDRVRGLTKADRDVDTAIYNALPQFKGSDAFRSSDRYGENDDGYRKRVKDWREWGPFPLDEFTGSIDAVVTLIERVLPGWFWTLNSVGNAFMHDRKQGGIGGSGSGPTPALALLLALIEALLSQGQETVG